MPEMYLFFLLLSFLLFVGIKIFSLRGNKPRPETLDLSLISFVIPFRNEEHNLPLLLNSILIQEYLPQSIIFIDDHSSDMSAEVIQAFIETNNIGDLLTLPKDNTGKKAALSYGIQKSETQFVLTLDADVVLNKKYMKTLSNLSANGLIALPVVMKGKSFLERLFSTEYTFFNAFNYLLSSIWPISISGANLLFNSKLVDYETQIKIHQHLASGDDYFLLKEFRKNQLPIHINNDYNLSVKTKAPTNLRAYFDQRVRWLSKSKFQVEYTDSLIGVFVLLYFLGGFTALIVAAISAQWMVLISVFILRFLLDALVYLNYAQRLRITRNILILPFFQLIYPVLFFAVLVLGVFYKPEWKGRETE